MAVKGLTAVASFYSSVSNTSTEIITVLTCKFQSQYYFWSLIIVMTCVTTFCIPVQSLYHSLLYKCTGHINSNYGYCASLMLVPSLLNLNIVQMPEIGTTFHFIARYKLPWCLQYKYLRYKKKIVLTCKVQSQYCFWSYLVLFDDYILR